MNFYAFNIGDYAAATQHLTWEEDLAYRRLLDVYYSREESIPLEPRAAYRLVRAASQDQREAVDSVLSEFFTKSENGYLHHRCDDEIAVARSKSDKARESAVAGWQKRGNANASKPDANAPEKVCERIKSGSEGNAPNPNPNPNHHPHDFDEVDAALRKIPGIDKHPIFAAPVIAPIWQLVLNGIDFKTIIVPSIKSQLQKARPGAIRNWGYFVNGILETAKISAPPEIQVTPDAWSKRLATARKSGQWDANWGVMPGQEGCLVPRELMLDGDGRGWQIWRKAA